jgi:predicted 2-oxoglutarate/Fe(II)-dependent dioxygenase YbiX
MSDNIKDYIKVKNVISVDVCNSLIEDISKEPWNMHQWTSYGDVVPQKDSSTELSVQAASPEHNKIVMPYIISSLQEYIYSFTEYSASKNWFKYGCNVRFNRYDVNTSMKIHYDHITSLFDGERKGIPVLSIVGLLNDDYKGGDFVFFKDHKVNLTAGDIMVFPSNFMYPHRVEEVTQGTRYSFVCWAW